MKLFPGRAKLLLSRLDAHRCFHFNISVFSFSAFILGGGAN